MMKQGGKLRRRWCKAGRGSSARTTRMRVGDCPLSSARSAGAAERAAVHSHPCHEPCLLTAADGLVCPHVAFGRAANQHQKLRRAPGHRFRRRKLGWPCGRHEPGHSGLGGPRPPALRAALLSCLALEHPPSSPNPAVAGRRKNCRAQHTWGVHDFSTALHLPAAGISSKALPGSR